MRKHTLLILFATFLTAGIGLWLYQSTQKSDNADLVVETRKLKVATTIFPVYDLVKNIGGDKVEVVNILPSGSSPHTFEPTPKDIQELTDTEIIFAIGVELDNWVQKIAPENAKIINLSEGIELLEGGHHHEGEGEHEGEEEEHEDGHDPHYWLSPTNAMTMVRTISNELSILDNENSEFYSRNLAEYKVKLENLISESQTKFTQYSGDGIVTFHDAYGYFAVDFGLNILTTIEPFPGKEPTAQYLEELIGIIEEYKIKVLFKEPQLSDKALKSVIDQKKIEIRTLDPLGGIDGRDSYIKLIEYNVDTIIGN